MTCKQLGNPEGSIKLTGPGFYWFTDSKLFTAKLKQHWHVSVVLQSMDRAPHAIAAWWLYLAPPGESLNGKWKPQLGTLPPPHARLVTITKDMLQHKSFSESIQVILT